MDKETEQFVDDLQAAYKDKRNESQQTTQALNSLYTSQQDPNLVEFQLELNDLLEKAFHLLSGSELTIDEQGNEIYTEPKDETLRPFN